MGSLSFSVTDHRTYFGLYPDDESKTHIFLSPFFMNI